MNKELSTPRTDAVVEMRRHDANAPELWHNEDVIPIIEHARQLECELKSKNRTMSQTEIFVGIGFGLFLAELVIIAIDICHKFHQ